MRKKLFIFLILQTCIAFAQPINLNEDATIKVITCGKGAELYTTFGHTAIRIEDTKNNVDVVYNFGLFDFRTSNFYAKFVKGDLQYFAGVCQYSDFIAEYKNEGRKVTEQTLNISKSQKQQLFDLLNKTAFSEDRYYTYKFIDRNCTTMVLEKINAILGTKNIEKTDSKTLSYREVLYPYFENHFWFKLGINIIFGERTDNKATQLFLPIELQNSLERYQTNGKKLVSETKTILPDRQTKSSFSFFDSIYFIILILAVLAILRNKKIFLFTFFLFGLLGLFLCMVGLYSQHQEVLWNYNALLFNPLFILMPFVKDKNKKILIYSILASLTLYICVLFNKPHFTLMLPFIIYTIFGLFWIYRVKQK